MAYPVSIAWSAIRQNDVFLGAAGWKHRRRENCTLKPTALGSCSLFICTKRVRILPALPWIHKLPLLCIFKKDLMFPKGFCDMPFLATQEREKMDHCLLHVVLPLGLIINRSPRVSTFILNDNSPPFYVSYSVICIFKLSSISLICIFKYLHLKQTKPPTHNCPWTLCPLPATNLLSLVFLSHPSFLKQKFTIPKKTLTRLPFSLDILCLWLDPCLK